MFFIAKLFSHITVIKQIYISISYEVNLFVCLFTQVMTIPSMLYIIFIENVGFIGVIISCVRHCQCQCRRVRMELETIRFLLNGARWYLEGS